MVVQATTARDIVYVPVIVGGTSQCRRSCATANVHSFMHAVVNCWVWADVGVFPPHILGLPAKSRACLGIRALSRKSVRFETNFIEILDVWDGELEIRVSEKIDMRPKIAGETRGTKQWSMDSTYAFLILSRTSQA